MACFVLSVAIGFCALVGMLAISDALNPERVPSVRPLPSHYPLRAAGPTREELLAMSDAERWETLQDSLAMLDYVCPEVSEWVRRRWYGGHLVFDMSERRCYAYYLPGLSVLGISLLGLLESREELACTLAHEFRHSRQNVLRGLQASIAAVFGQDRLDELVESPAYAFGDRVRRAIRGEP